MRIDIECDINIMAAGQRYQPVIHIMVDGSDHVTIPLAVCLTESEAMDVLRGLEFILEKPAPAVTPSTQTHGRRVYVRDDEEAQEVADLIQAMKKPQ